MHKVALCNCPKSRKIVEEKIADFLGNSATECQFFEFATVGEMTATGSHFDLIFLNKNLLGDLETLIQFIQTDKKETPSFINYVDDPISDDDFAKVTEYIRQHLEYTSMYFAVEFLTDKGLRSIAISKILYFEFLNRKVRIKAQNGEYFCNDTLRNVLSLVGNYDFYQPHKSFIVNLKHVASVKNYMITMSDGSLIPLSQKRSKDFRAAYKVV